MDDIYEKYWPLLQSTLQDPASGWWSAIEPLLLPGPPPPPTMYPPKPYILGHGAFSRVLQVLAPEANSDNS